MKSAQVLVLCTATVLGSGCATSHKDRYDTDVAGLPSSVGAAAWIAVRVDKQTGETWYWRGDTTNNERSKPQWHRIKEPSDELRNIVGTTTVAHTREVLVERPGQFTSDDKKTTIEVTASKDGHLNFRIECLVQMQVPGLGEKVAVKSSRSFDLGDKDGLWAYCTTNDGNVWLYDGEMFTRFRRLPDQIAMLQSCTEPTLGDQAPALLKSWVAKRTTESDE